MPCYWPRSESTLVQVMPCCLTAPSHHLNRCWLLLIAVLLDLLEADKLVGKNGNFEESEIFYTVQELFLVVCDSFTCSLQTGHLCCADLWVIAVFCLTFGKCLFYVCAIVFVGGLGYCTYYILVFFCIHLQSYHRITDHGSTWSYFNGLICNYIFLGPRI